MHGLLKESSILKLMHDSLEELLMLVLLFVNLVAQLSIVTVILVHAVMVASKGHLLFGLSQSVSIAGVDWDWETSLV